MTILRTLLFLCVVLTMALSMSGCGGTGTIVVSKDFDIPVPTAAKIPLRAGLRLEEAYIGKVFLPVANAAPVYMGDALRTGTMTVCANIFRESVVIDSGMPVPSGIDAIVTPSCELVKYDVVERATARVRTQIRWRVTRPDGRMIYSSTITGEAVRKLSATIQASTMEREQGELYFLSLQDGFRKAQLQLITSPWWEVVPDDRTLRM